MLSWARETAGFSREEAARKIGASLPRLVAWEEGTAHPTIRQARLLGGAYHRPAAFFYLAEPPEPPPDLPDFRRLAGTEPSRNPGFAHEIRRARYRRQVALDVASVQGEQPVEFRLSLSMQDDPAASGRKLRNALAISSTTQQAWRDSYKALASWTRAAEQVGALVFQFGRIDIEVARGFSIVDRPLPAVSLNAKDAPTARIFTLMHELTHLGLAEPGICDLHEGRPNFPIETYCNAVAAEALVPASEFLLQSELTGAPGGDGWSDSDIKTLARRFSVSREVILRRLLELGKASQSYYRKKRAELLEEYKQIEPSGGFILYHKKVIRDNGPAFTTLVLNAYYEQSISAVDLSRYLGGLHLTHLSAIEQELFA
jgi:Zn-dependent peptidase ImmA (M78 family)/DNA-binding XRE family transcriptional regulator